RTGRTARPPTVTAGPAWRRPGLAATRSEAHQGRARRTPPPARIARADGPPSRSATWQSSVTEPHLEPTTTPPPAVPAVGIPSAAPALPARVSRYPCPPRPTPPARRPPTPGAAGGARSASGGTGGRSAAPGKPARASRRGSRLAGRAPARA